MLNYFNHITFANKELLWFLLLIPAIITWYVLKQEHYFAELKVSSTQGLDAIKPSIKQHLRHLLFVLRVLAIALLIITLARPQSNSSWKNVSTKGIDIVMALDISSSMLAKDFTPNRLEAAKEVAIDFINERPNDRVGLVLFAGESFTQCPLTSDHAIIKNLFASIQPGMIEDGTAMGNGLATAVTRLKNSESKSKVIILITDGVNNRGSVAPLTAADIARTFGIRVYTIGVGTRGQALSPTAVYPDGSFEYTYVDVTIDEKALKEIATSTGAQYFRATDNNSLKDIYTEIDRLEKTIFEEKNFSNKAEHFLPFALLAAFLLFVEFLLKNTYLKRVP